MRQLSCHSNRILLLIKIVIILLTISSCYHNYSIYISPDQLYFKANDTERYTVQIKTDGEWFVSEVAPYISVEPKSGFSSQISVRIAEPNKSRCPRRSTIVVKSFEQPENIGIIEIFQEGNEEYGY